MDATYIDLTIRLSLALLLGGAIGIEREYRAKEAGFRTHFLVALGSALFCVVSQYGFGSTPNPNCEPTQNSALPNATRK